MPVARDFKIGYDKDRKEFVVVMDIIEFRFSERAYFRFISGLVYGAKKALDLGDENLEIVKEAKQVIEDYIARSKGGD